METDKYLLNYSEKITVTGPEQIIENFDLSKINEINPCSISGFVKDSIGKTLESVTVNVFTIDFEPVTHELTLSSGEYCISNLPCGDYIVLATESDYDIPEAQLISLSGGHIVLDDFILIKKQQGFTIYGIVWEFYHEIIQLLNQVDIQISQVINGEKIPMSVVTTADDGEYMVEVHETGTYFIEIRDRYYETKDKSLYVEVISEVSHISLNIEAIRVNDVPECTINGTVRDKNTLIAIKGATVLLYLLDEDQNEHAIDSMLTDSNGRYFFGVVREGKYKIKVKLQE